MPDAKDARANLLYSSESSPLRIGDAWRLLVKSWPFISRYRGLVAIKCGLVLCSLSILTKRTPFWIVGIIATLSGVGIAATAFLVH